MIAENLSAEYEHPHKDGRCRGNPYSQRDVPYELPTFFFLLLSRIAFCFIPHEGKPTNSMFRPNQLEKHNNRAFMEQMVTIT